MDSGQKFRGIVVSEAPMGEKDKRIVLLTKEMGKVSVLAKGALGPKSKSASVSALFCYGDYILSKGKSFYYIQEATLIESFYALREDLDRLSYSTLLLEIAGALSLEGTENQGLLRLLLKTLLAMEKAKGERCRLITMAFIFRALSEAGFSPNLSECALCQKPLQEGPGGEVLEERIFFSPLQGDCLCEACEQKVFRPGDLSFGRGAQNAMSWILFCDVDRLYDFTLSGELLETLYEAAIRFLHAQTERNYRALQFIQGLQ